MSDENDGPHLKTQVADAASPEPDALDAHPGASDIKDAQPLAPSLDRAETAPHDGGGSAPPAPLAIQQGASQERDPRGEWRFLKASWPALVAGVPALLTLVALTFSLFPWLEPTPPPEVRSVTITDFVLGERNKDLGDGRIANALYFEIETVGYDAENIAVDWLVYDAETRERLAEPEEPVRWGVIDIGTRSDRIVGEIEVPPPMDHTGCVFVRVLLQPLLVGGQTPDPSRTRLLLDVVDTKPFDPYDATNERCPDSPPSESEAT